MKLNYIGSLNLPNSHGVTPLGNGAFAQATTTQLQQSIYRLFNGVEFSWGNFTFPPSSGYLTAYSNLALAEQYLPQGIYSGGGLAQPGLFFDAKGDYAWFNTQSFGIGPGNLVGAFGYSNSNVMIRGDYRTYGQSPGSHASQTTYKTGLFHSTGGGGVVLDPPEFAALPGVGGINPLADCTNVCVHLLGFKSATQAYVAIDAKVTTFPPTIGHDVINDPLFPVGSVSTQAQYGSFAILNLTNGNYELMMPLFQMGLVTQQSHDNGDGTASAGAMLQDLTQSFTAPLLDGAAVFINSVVDTDGNFAAQDDRRFINVTSGIRTQTMQWALNYYGTPQALAETGFGSPSQWYHQIFKSGAYPTGPGLYGVWNKTSANDYSEYTLQAENGAPENFTVPYCVVNGVPDGLILERYRRPGIPLNYPMPFNNWLGVIYYRGLPCFIFQDNIGNGGPVTYDVYVPIALQYAVAFNGMRNFTRPISSSTGDNFS